MRYLIVGKLANALTAIILACSLAAGLATAQSQTGDSAHGVDRSPAVLTTASKGQNRRGPPVLCVREIVILLTLWVEFCSETDNKDAQKSLGRSLDRIHRFIVENSTESMTLEQLENGVERYRLREKKLFETTEDQQKACRKSDFKPPDEFMTTAGIEAFERQLDEILAVPREPVFNPCL